MHKFLLENRNDILLCAHTLGITEIYITKVGDDTTIYSIGALINLSFPQHIGADRGRYLQSIITIFSQHLQTQFGSMMRDVKIYHKASIEEALNTNNANQQRTVFQNILSSAIPLQAIEDRDLFQQFHEQQLKTAPVTIPPLQVTFIANPTPLPSFPAAAKLDIKRKESDVPALQQEFRQLKIVPDTYHYASTQPRQTFWQPTTLPTLSPETATIKLQIKTILLALQNHANKDIWHKLTKNTDTILSDLQKRFMTPNQSKKSRFDVDEKYLKKLHYSSLGTIGAILEALESYPELLKEAKINPEQVIQQFKIEIESAKSSSHSYKR